MIGKKDIELVNTGRKFAKRFLGNLQNFTEHDFFVRVYLVDEHRLAIKTIEAIVNTENVLDYLDAMDFGDYQIDKIEFSASGR